MKDFAFRSKPIVFQRTPTQRRSRLLPETVVSRPRGDRVCSQRRLRLLPDSPTGIGSLLSGFSFLERTKKEPKAQKRFGLSFFLGLSGSVDYKFGLISPHFSMAGTMFNVTNSSRILQR